VALHAIHHALTALSLRPLPRPALCPYPTLFRSALPGAVLRRRVLRGEPPGGRRLEPLDVGRRGGRRQVGIVRRGLGAARPPGPRSEEHTSELQSRENLVCRLLLEKKKRSNTLSE